MAESPEVNALGGSSNMLGSDQSRRLANRRAVGRANGITVEIMRPWEICYGSLGVPRVSLSYPMARVGTEETGESTCRAPG